MNDQSPVLKAAGSLYGFYESVLNHAQGALLLIVRLTWGGFLVQTGWGKWQDIPKVVGFFTEIGIPFPEVNACIVASVELFGGLFLILGLLSRLAPLPIIFAMIVAYATTEGDALQALVTGNPDPFLAAAPFVFLFAALLILVFGPGYLSADALIFRRLGWGERQSGSTRRD
jgi:putative oxidoreductase